LNLFKIINLQNLFIKIVPIFILASNFLIAQADDLPPLPPDALISLLTTYAFLLFIYWVTYRVVGKIYHFIKSKLKS
jgi:hypothetical protein